MSNPTSLGENNSLKLQRKFRTISLSISIFKRLYPVTYTASCQEGPPVTNKLGEARGGGGRGMNERAMAGEKLDGEKPQIFFETFLQFSRKSVLPLSFSKYSRNSKILQPKNPRFAKSITLLSLASLFLYLTDPSVHLDTQFKQPDRSPDIYRCSLQHQTDFLNDNINNQTEKTVRHTAIVKLSRHRTEYLITRIESKNNQIAICEDNSV